jgi:hypothetical protein
MVITFVFRPGQPLLISPDPALVQRGDQVTWVIGYGGPEGFQFRRLLYWTVYFQSGNPFSPSPKLELTWHPDRLHPTASAEISSPGAERPGDYKYGIRSHLIASHEVQSDDDPYLIVR